MIACMRKLLCILNAMDMKWMFNYLCLLELILNNYFKAEFV